MAIGRSVAVAAVGIVVLAGAGALLLRQMPHTAPAPSGAVSPAAAPQVTAPQPGAAAPAQTACLLPGPIPVVPDGRLASAADMQLARGVIQGFVEQLEAYQTCLNAKVDHPAPGVTDAQKDEWVRQGNGAIDEAHALADSFGQQLKLFKARGPGK